MVIPLFSSAASRTQGGLFLTEKAGYLDKAKRRRGPPSLCDIAKADGLKRLYLVDDRMINYFAAYRHLKEVGCDLHFGLKVVVCENMADKTPASRKTESSVVIFMARNTPQVYEHILALASAAAQEGFYDDTSRLDWPTLTALWHDDLLLALPFYSSFLARNTLTFATIVPHLPARPLLLREIGQQVAVDDLLNEAVDTYAIATGALIQPVKSIYYRSRADSKAWQVWRSILKRSTWDKPNMDGCTSREFSLEAWKELTA